MLRILLCIGVLMLVSAQSDLNPAAFDRKTVSVRDFGAVGDGVTLDWEACVKAIAAIEEVGGGTVIVPKGRYVTGPLNLTSNLKLVIEGDAVVMASGDRSVYPPGRNAVINGYNVANVWVGGGGVLDGQGGVYWWPKIPSISREMREDEEEGRENGEVLEPFLMECKGCRDVWVGDVVMLNSPFWTVHPYNCSYWTMSNLTIHAPINGPNIDCIDPDSSNHILIENSVLACGDDHVSVKASPGIPSYNIMIRNTRFLHGQGMTIGSEVRGGVWNVTFRDSVMVGGIVGMRFKTVRNRGGFARDIFFDNLVFETVGILVSVNMDFNHDQPATNTSLIPTISNVYMNNISGWGVMSMKLVCLPESPCTNFDLAGVNTVICQDFECSHVSGQWRNCSHPVPCSMLTPAAQ